MIWRGSTQPKVYYILVLSWLIARNKDTKIKIKIAGFQKALNRLYF